MTEYKINEQDLEQMRILLQRLNNNSSNKFSYEYNMILNIINKTKSNKL